LLGSTSRTSFFSLAVVANPRAHRVVDERREDGGAESSGEGMVLLQATAAVAAWIEEYGDGG